MGEAKQVNGVPTLPSL